MQTKQNNLIVELTFTFALDIIDFTELLESQRKYVIARQLLKCGTSIGANVWEAQNAESLADFIHKMKVAAKEADETEYWLMLCNRSEQYPSNEELLLKQKSIIKVLSKIIASSKNKT